MGNYKSIYTGEQIDDAVGKVAGVESSAAIGDIGPKVTKNESDISDLPA